MYKTIQVLDQLLCPKKGWRFEPNPNTKADVLCNVTNMYKYFYK